MDQEREDYGEPHWPPFWVLEFVAVLVIAVAVAVAAYLYLSSPPPARPPVVVTIGGG